MADLITELRVGTCDRYCGACCMSGDPFNGERGVGQIPGACPLLTRDPDGRYSCSDRNDPYYRNGCHLFPTIPAHVASYPTCTYRFIQLD